MATHRINMLGANTVPDTGGNVFFEPYTIKATNDVWGYLVAVFNDTATRDGLRGKFNVPQNYVDTANLVIVWTSTATSGDVEWDFDYRAVGGVESLDQSGTQESVNGNDAAPTSTDLRTEFPIALTDGNFAAGDEVQFEFFRDGTDGGDGISAAVQLHALYFEYNDA